MFPDHLRPRTRRGTALLVALTLLTLASALLIGTSHAARATAQSARTSVLALQLDSEARLAAARVAGTWGTAEETLRVGESLSRTTAMPNSSTGLPLELRTRLIRLSDHQYALGIDVQSHIGDRLIGQRRLRVLLRSEGDSLPEARRVTPISRWSLSDLY